MRVDFYPELFFQERKLTKETNNKEEKMEEKFEIDYIMANRMHLIQDCKILNSFSTGAITG